MQACTRPLGSWPGQNPLVAITVTGHARRPVARAANDLARTVVFSDALANYSKTKIANLQQQVDQEKVTLSTLNANLKAQQAALKDSSGLSTSERLIALGQLNGLQAQLLTTTDQLTTNPSSPMAPGSDLTPDCGADLSTRKDSANAR